MAQNSSKGRTWKRFGTVRSVLGLSTSWLSNGQDAVFGLSCTTAHMHLTDLKRSGTRLRNVEPLFAGMALAEWLRKMVSAQCDAFVNSQDKDSAPLSKQRLWNKRDSYG